MILCNNTILSTVYLQSLIRISKLFIILIVLVFQIACSSSTTKAPISSRVQPPTTKVLHHVVAPGETLYSIAWRYNLDYKKLAQANEISSLYNIYPGQLIRLDDKPSIAVAAKPRKNVPFQPVSKPRQSSQPAPTKKSVSTKPSKKTRAVVPVAPRPEKKPSSLPLISSTEAIYFKWPAKGKVITNFYRNKGLKKGIDIEGKKGDSVFSAAGGKVVYAGDGIRGYGQLIIIKHNQTYLSAYAHNSVIRVKEGDIVKLGQHIADIGSTGEGVNGKTKLHFQIRRDGKPINPLPLLPKRKS